MIALYLFGVMTGYIVWGMPNVLETVLEDVNVVEEVVVEDNDMDRNDLLKKHYKLKKEYEKNLKDYWNFDTEVIEYEKSLEYNFTEERLEELYKLKERLEELDKIKSDSFSKLYDFSKKYNIPI